MIFFRPSRGVTAFGVGLLLLAGCIHDTKMRRPAKQNRPATALFDLQPAPELSQSQLSDVQISLAATWERQGKTKDAASAYLRALEHDPSRADAASRLAVLCDQQSDFASSEKYHRQALRYRPKNANYLCNYGYSLYLQERWNEAEQMFRAALNADPQHQRAANNLGLVMAQTGKEKEAYHMFRRAGATSAEAHNNMAFALALHEQFVAARKHYYAALQNNPSLVPAKKGLTQVNRMLAQANTPARAVVQSPTTHPVQQVSGVQIVAQEQHPVPRGCLPPIQPALGQPTSPSQATLSIPEQHRVPKDCLPPIQPAHVQTDPPSQATLATPEEHPVSRYYLPAIQPAHVQATLPNAYPLPRDYVPPTQPAPAQSAGAQQYPLFINNLPPIQSAPSQTVPTSQTTTLPASSTGPPFNTGAGRRLSAPTVTPGHVYYFTQYDDNAKGR